MKLVLWLKKSIFFIIASILLHVPLSWSTESGSDKANALFDELFDESVDRSPIRQGYLGIKDNNDKWDDISETFELQSHEITKKQLSKLQTLKVEKLDAVTKLSYQLLEKSLKDDIKGFKWRHHGYPVNQMFGLHSQIPAFLINIHQVSNEKDAKAYVSRLNGVPKLIDQLIDGLELRQSKGILPPKFVFAHVIRDSENVISGAPFSKTDDSTLMADFKKKVNNLDLKDKSKQKLIKKAEKALKKKVGPAYKKLITSLKALEKKANTNDGVWKFPEGDAYYEHALEKTTTSSLSAEEIHNIGLKDVDRIHNEMREIMTKVKFKGTLQEFFVFMRDDKQFYYPQTDEGKARYLKEAVELIDTMKAKLDGLFITKPKADLIVKQVEPFREKSAGKAFYQRPAPDGSRPGIYYANLYNMANMPTYQMEALAYHEGIPGHHMQLSIAQEIENFPKFRKFGSYTAYIEGWGLYSELLPKEFGLYSDPYSDFGRLAMELWRACRLVVDTGIHAKKWTREKAIDYLVQNTPNARDDSVRAIERYIVLPSQATAYKVGMIKILELRALAQKALGDKYDIREFHDVILKNGAVPLTVLENLINEWITAKST